jgi:hypothetical protein
MTTKISKTQLAALRTYAEYLQKESTTPRCCRLDTHCALLRRGLLEVAYVGETRTVYHTYAYNFGRLRITKGHLESTARFCLTDAGRAAING